MTAIFNHDHIDFLVTTWLSGWRLMRGLPEPVPVEGGLRVEFGQPHRTYEFIALNADSSPVGVRRLCHLASETTGMNWLTITTHSADATEVTVREAGLELAGPCETLMTCDFDTRPGHDLPEGYRLTTSTGEGVVRATIFSPTDEVAASGQMAVLPQERTAVPDKIETSPARRRRGLGSRLMAALTEEASKQGVTRGLLVASPEGKLLYESLGWTTVASVLVARTPLLRE
ncbi:GNAT family N-acetyltransferase [Specibacter cremeus]|uniref:GNAT family N-acetyltransferase n=1 Tax=Specibacter cremeus TaxID=1629051 RepID=UPI000F77B63F|nr:GNAT family N-acetyltransferase [Specibacter cremeus]